MVTLGIDIGGSGIKGALVDTESGELITKRFRIETPKQPDRATMLGLLRTIVDHFQWQGPVGCGFPGVIRANTILTAANLSAELIGWNLGNDLGEICGGPCIVLNDADAAGNAEVQMGAGKFISGTVLVVTIGTGIGTALFTRGQLVANTELGHIIFRGKDAELMVSERARKQLALSWREWGRCFSGYLKYMEELFWPECIILGGGGIKKRDKMEPYLKIDTPLEYAQFGNRAGMIGAALAVTHLADKPSAIAIKKPGVFKAPGLVEFKSLQS